MPWSPDPSAFSAQPQGPQRLLAGSSRGLAEDQGDLDEAGQRGEAPTQVPTTQDFEKFHVHAKSVRGS